MFIMIFAGGISFSITRNMMDNQQVSSTSSDEKYAKKKTKKEDDDLKIQEDKKKREEAKRQQEEEIYAKRKVFDSRMSDYVAFDTHGQAGREFQIIVNDNWNYMDYREKQNFVINTAQTVADCGLAGTITELSFRFSLDGRKLATFDSSDGVRVYR